MRVPYFRKPPYSRTVSGSPSDVELYNKHCWAGSDGRASLLSDVGARFAASLYFDMIFDASVAPNTKPQTLNPNMPEPQAARKAT